MGRPRKEPAPLDIERRRDYRRNRYYRTRQELLSARALTHANNINALLDLHLSAEQLSSLQAYLQENCKFTTG